MKLRKQHRPDDREAEEISDEPVEKNLPEEDIDLGIKDGKDDTVFMRDEPDLHPEEEAEDAVFPNEETDDIVLPEDIDMPEEEEEKHKGRKA